jgi:signal transduction histidine kinase
LDYLESFFGAAAGAKGVAFTAELDPRVPEVLRGDEVRLRQVMVNLLGNAMKFTTEGKVSLKVGLSSKPPPFGYARLLVEVEDTGIGIGSEQLDSVFESYSQATKLTHAKYGGTGLGLSISRELVALMGGEIGVQSQEGRGSRFYFEVELENPLIVGFVSSAQ